MLSDLGAVLQIMRLAGREDGWPKTGLGGLRIASPGWGCRPALRQCRGKPSSAETAFQPSLKPGRTPRMIAENSRFLAEEDRLPINPDDAYLIGLFHAIGSMPEILGWDCTVPAFSDPDLVGLRMAEAWSLPRCVVEYFCELRSISKTNRWTEIVKRAHHFAAPHVIEDSLDEHAPLQRSSGTWMQLVSH